MDLIVVSLVTYAFGFWPLFVWFFVPRAPALPPPLPAAASGDPWPGAIDGSRHE